eukprot:2906149-Karenia_brevis.AAC.1
MGQEGSYTYLAIAAKDSKLTYFGATCLLSKWVGSYSVSFMVGLIRDVGHERMILKCDNEPAIVALRSAVIKQCDDLELWPQGPPEGDHRAHGLPESLVNEMKRQIKILRKQTERALSVRIPDDSPALAWLPRFAASTLNKNRIGSDGKQRK